VTAPVVEAPGEVGFGRELPHDIRAEMVTIGGMLLARTSVEDVLGILKAPDYYRPAHQVIHLVVARMYGEGRPVDAVTVAAEMARTGELRTLGDKGALYLTDCIAVVPQAAHAASYAREVREQAIYRRCVEAGERIAGFGWSRVGYADDLAGQAVAEAEGILADRVSGALEPMSVLMPQFLDAIENGTSAAGRLPTGFADLDDLLGGGLAPGQFVIVAARPAIGKSTLALDMARFLSVDRTGKPAVDVQFESAEMSRTEIGMRMIAAESRVGAQAILEGRLSDDDWHRVNRVRGRLSDARLWIDADETVSLASVRARFAELCRLGHRPALIVIDYLQLMVHPGRFGNRQEQVSDLSRQLKIFAMREQVPVVVLCQLNRGPEQRNDHRPLLSDLRESGSLEQDADIVILLHREDAYERESPRAGEADFIVAKHRNGPTSTITVAFQGHYNRFTDMAPVGTTQYS